MVMAKKLLMDIQECSSIILHTLPLLHACLCINVHEDLQEDLIHQENVNLECITLIAKIYPIQAFMSQLDI